MEITTGYDKRDDAMTGSKCNDNKKCNEEKSLLL